MQLVQMFRPSCSIGVVGTEASVTVQGWMAGKTCDAFSNGLHQPGGGAAGQLYQLTEAPSQPIICEYVISGQTFLVRDQGVIKLTGNALCQYLKTQVR
jgi:hypothetical protein